MANDVLHIHVVADSTGESGARLARAALVQFPRQQVEIVQHRRTTTTEALLGVLDDLRREDAAHVVVLSTLVSTHMRELVAAGCADLGIRHVDLLGETLAAITDATGHAADEVAMRPVQVDTDYFTRIAAMDFVVRNDDGAAPARLRECDICLVGPSRSGKTPLAIFLGYLGYKATNVPLVPGIEPPEQLFAIDPWRIVGLTMDAERLLQIRSRRVKGLGGFGTRDGYADLAKIYDELDHVGAIMRRLRCPVIDTTGLALEEAAGRVIDIVDQRAARLGAHLERPAGTRHVSS